MAVRFERVKRALTRLSAAELIDRARAHVMALTNNLHFPSPVPSLAMIETAIEALVLADADVVNNGGRQDYLARNERMRDLRHLLILLAAYVQMESAGDTELIHSAGFGVRATGKPAGLLTAPANLRARSSPLPGAIRVRRNGVRHRLLYEVQICQGSPDPAHWKTLTLQGFNHCDATDLESHVECCFRVRAIGAAGPGPWSDIAIERAR